MKAVLLFVAVMVVGLASCTTSFADGASTSKKGGTSPSQKQTNSQSRGSAQDLRQPQPVGHNSTPSFQFQQPNFNPVLSQSVLDRLKKSKK